jgi:flagellar motor switch protein FliN/FliY
MRGVLHEEGGPAPATSGFDSVAGSVRNSGVIMNIPVDVQIVLGSAEMPVSELMALQKGSTVALNRRIGEAVDVMVNGRRIAKGEITAEEAVRAYHGVLQGLGVKPLRSLEDDLKLQTGVMSYGARTQVQVPDKRSPVSPQRASSTTGSPNFSKMTREERLAYYRSRITRF